MKHPFLPGSFLLLAGLLLACNQTQQQGDTAKAIPSKVKVNNAGVNIAYTETGKGDTTLLFVHGWGINKGYWLDQIKAFSNRYRVVAMDMAGFGQSGKNRNKWDTQAFANDVDSVISQLKLKNVILIGHSMSGNVVLQTAIDQRERVIGLVGIDNFKSPGAPSTPESQKGYEAAMAELHKHFKSFVKEWFDKELFYKTTTTQVRSRVMADVNKADSTIAIASLEDTTFHEIPKLQQARKKLYVIGSDVSPVDTTHMVAAKLPFKIYYVHATGHYPMIEKPAEFNAQLTKVLDEIGRDKQ